MRPVHGMKIAVTPNGPYLVEGAVPIARQTIVADEDGNSVDWGQGEQFETRDECRLCRCGQSANKPFCDDSHLRVEFDGTETAGRDPYLTQAAKQDGPTLILTDVHPCVRSPVSVTWAARCGTW